MKMLSFSHHFLQTNMSMHDFYASAKQTRNLGQGFRGGFTSKHALVSVKEEVGRIEYLCP